MIKTLCFHCRGPGFHPLVGELRSHMPQREAPLKKKKKKKERGKKSHSSLHFLSSYIVMWRTVGAPLASRWAQALLFLVLGVLYDLREKQEEEPSCFCLRKLPAAAKSLQLCLTLCDPIDGSPPGSPIPGILQARSSKALIYRPL